MLGCISIQTPIDFFTKLSVGYYVLKVETAVGSAPCLSLLAPLDAGSPHSYWRAPPSASSVDFVIVLSNLSDVSAVILLVSPCGYSMSDAPIVSLLCAAYGSIIDATAGYPIICTDDNVRKGCLVVMPYSWSWLMCNSVEDLRLGIVRDI